MFGIKWEEREVDVDALIPFERNPRTITPDAYAKLLSSLRDNGYHQRILATQDLRIIGGHQRKKALKELGMTTVKVLSPDRALTDAQFRRILVQDNLAFGEFDREILRSDYSKSELIGWGLPSDWAGFTEKKAAPVRAEECPAIASVAVTCLGDTWILGNHRLRCGDSTNPEDVTALLAGETPPLMVTDPPYGVDYDPSWRDKVDGVWSSSRATGKVDNDDRADWSAVWALFPGNAAYVWHGGLHSSTVADNLLAAGFALRAQIIWVKQHFVFGRGDYHWKHEPCWYAVRKGEKGNWQGDRKQSTVWEINNASAMGGTKDDTTSGHGTQKPIECMKRPIENNSQEGDGIYEPFSGSGTTIIACEITNRRCFAMELNPLYVDMAVKRWQQYTGLTAHKATLHNQPAQTFDDQSGKTAA